VEIGVRFPLGLIYKKVCLFVLDIGLSEGKVGISHSNIELLNSPNHSVFWVY